MSNKVALVTGASSGIGFDAAVDLQKAGFTVYGAARRVDKLKDLEKHGVETIQLDVTDEASMAACVNTIVSKEGRVDVLVNNAGYGYYGAVESVTMEEARRQVEVNVFGLARMSQLVLPHMRKQKFGRIINISSIGGKVTTPFGGWYHATKFAVEALSDCMRVETEEFGIDVVLIEPGAIKTDWGFIAADHLEEGSKGTPYEASAQKGAKTLRDNYSSNRISNPKIISDAIVKASTSRKPKTRYLIGFGAKPMLFMRRLLSDRMYDRIVRSL